MHPIFAADRDVVPTIDQALMLAEPGQPHLVGVMVDTYHLWWDPAVLTLIERAGERIAGYQVCD